MCAFPFISRVNTINVDCRCEIWHSFGCPPHRMSAQSPSPCLSAESNYAQNLYSLYQMLRKPIVVEYKESYSNRRIAIWHGRMQESLSWGGDRTTLVIRDDTKDCWHKYRNRWISFNFWIRLIAQNAVVTHYLHEQPPYIRHVFVEFLTSD